jgi:hypothetical protein
MSKKHSKTEFLEAWKAEPIVIFAETNILSILRAESSSLPSKTNSDAEHSFCSGLILMIFLLKTLSIFVATEYASNFKRPIFLSSQCTFGHDSVVFSTNYCFQATPPSLHHSCCCSEFGKFRWQCRELLTKLEFLPSYVRES